MFSSLATLSNRQTSFYNRSRVPISLRLIQAESFHGTKEVARKGLVGNNVSGSTCAINRVRQARLNGTTKHNE